LRNYVQAYGKVIEPLLQRKTLLIKGFEVTLGSARKAVMNKVKVDNPTKAELEAFDYLKQQFSRPSTIVHFSSNRKLWIDLDGS